VATPARPHEGPGFEPGLTESESFIHIRLQSSSTTHRFGPTAERHGPADPEPFVLRGCDRVTHALTVVAKSALDQAAPLQGWTLPQLFQHLRRLLEARTGNRGKREFIQVLRLMEVFPETIVANAALDAIRLGAIGFNAVKQLAIAKVEHRPARLDLGDYPYLPAANVKMTSAADYAILVSGRAA